MQTKPVTIRKRAQIAAENRVMFTWVAGASIIVGFAVVGSIFLTQVLMFNERVISEKNKTAQVLSANKLAIPTLEANIRKLDANQALIDSKASPDDRAIQVILDALPSSSNPEALGASLQSRLLTGVDGLTLNSLQVDSTPSAEALISGAAQLSGNNEISFSFSVSGDEVALAKVLRNLESSVRTINITSIRIESQNNIRTLSAQAKAFFEPVIKADLKDKVVK